MSYKLDLSDLKRDADTSLTQQLVDRFVAAIEADELAAGDKLPTTRALAEEAGINHLTAARVYRRLAELGYVTASVGRGTFVRTLAPAADERHGDDWQIYALPDRPLSYAEQVLSDAFHLPADSDVVSLATGWPSLDLYPTEAIARITTEIFEEEGPNAIAYLASEGLYDLREQIARHGSEQGWSSDPEEIIVTSGARQGIDLVARALLEPGDVAVIESPTFVGGLTSLRAPGARVIGIPVDEDGFDVDALERVLARHEVKLCMLQTACQNPTGRDLSPERRDRLAELAIARNFFVAEDGVYADLRFEGKAPAPLRGAAPGHVLHINSVSKTVGGGLRVGWIAARGPVFERLATLKQESDFHSTTLAQHIAARFMKGDLHRAHVERTLPFYRERRDALLDSLEQHLEGEYTATRPAGGHHVWVTLNRPINERDLYAEAARHGVTFTPGGAMTAERHSQTSLRLSFSLLDPPELDEGVRRLSRAIRQVRRSHRHSATVPLS
jgi:DNA-binding transcriptional MocR family regulator